MSGYIAIKCATFNSVEYQAGSFVPENAVLASRVASLIRNGVIAPADSAAQGTSVELCGAEQTENIKIPIQTENGSEELSATSDDLVTAISLLQMKPDEIIAAIEGPVSAGTLKVVDACSRAQAIHKAIRVRLARMEQEDGGETT